MRAIDLFAGAGGSSTGLAQAGLEVAWSGNHNPEAVRVHAANHPGVEHVCQDLHQADWYRVPSHDLLWASPACQGHSPAASRYGTGRRGTAASADADRATSWAVIAAAEVQRPEWIVVENVVEFRRWSLHAVWRQALATLGYEVEEHVLSSADYGVPQDRKRLYTVGRLGRLPKLGAALEHHQADETRGSRSVFDPGAEGWRVVSAGDAAGLIRRAAKAEKHLARDGACLTQAVTGHPGRALDRALPTITTKHQLGWLRREGRHTLYRPFTGLEYARGMGFPDTYDWLGNGVTEVCRLAGNAVTPAVAAALGAAILGAA